MSSTQPQFNKNMGFLQSNVNDIYPDLITYSLDLGQKFLTGRSEKHRKSQGQFLTPADVARFMANQLGPIRSGDRILDPAIGSGVLACAVIERLIEEGQRSATARCRTDTQLLRLPRTRLIRVIEDYPEIGFRIMRHMAADLMNKLQSSNLNIREKLF